MCGEKMRKDLFFACFCFVFAISEKKKKKKKKRSYFCEDRLINPYTDKGGTLQILAQADYIAQTSYISKASGDLSTSTVYFS